MKMYILIAILLTSIFGIVYPKVLFSLLHFHFSEFFIYGGTIKKKKVLNLKVRVTKNL